MQTFISPGATLALSVVILAACSNLPAKADRAEQADSDTVDVKIIAFNDLHGHLEPPHLSVAAPGPDNTMVALPAGGASYMASAIRQLKLKNPNHAVVSAGDMIGASPLVSALFLDEPTIETMNAFGIDFNAVGNHEFDKGSAELLRMQHGGCTQYTQRKPCALNGRFDGANFGFLAANVFRKNGGTLFPATGIKSFGSGAQSVRVGFIGMTLKNTPNIVAPTGVAGLTFRDEAATANALIPRLKNQGADAIVVLIHQGGAASGGYNDHNCPNLSGEIVPILERLDPAVDIVISGHTHRSYICDYGKKNPTKPFLLTSAGQYGTLLTDIDLRIDRRTRKVVAKSASNLIVQGDGFVNDKGATITPSTAYPRFGKAADVDAIITRYADAAAPLAQRVVGRLTATLSRTPVASGESPLGNLVADAQLEATRAVDNGGAQLALMNPGGLRADLGVPDGGGELTYAQLFKAQPFGNNLIVKTLNGRQLRAVLEQQFASGTNTVSQPRVLFPSKGFTYAYDLRKPVGKRIADMRLHGTPIRDGTSYRVTMNSYLASGGDNFEKFNNEQQVSGGDLDVNALESWIRTRSPVSPPELNRITRIDAPGNAR
ncbi:MAG TPA: bifunctional metallophosphatase/5'-nucleotidase [Oxalicibacterium sp.]|uniref:bifunctional metallophosphatase/5'-nucleotidase n=1 Tax=Oxalicibacterium sp. TaxID=2766525 RepID=UPI002B74ED51|nr:bifunctional metallophosphatase/5'-nucleotidase [Oxalicibacterium sp.]HWU97534.1 bifunctional metallophosphatase/5'-nucleotidase [Oxalicibacterium sp.]